MPVKRYRPARRGTVSKRQWVTVDGHDYQREWYHGLKGFGQYHSPDKCRKCEADRQNMEKA